MASVVPADDGHAVLTMTCANPDRVLDDLQHLADFPLRLEGP
jgi:predicted transglutaminase-like cysteine proteinase